MKRYVVPTGRVFWREGYYACHYVAKLRKTDDIIDICDALEMNGMFDVCGIRFENGERELLLYEKQKETEAKK